MLDTFDEMVYLTLLGEVSAPYRIPGVENAYAEGSQCDLLYQNLSDAYERLRIRLGINGEDDDTELIIGNLLTIQHTLCLKMFHYGKTIR